MNIFLEKRQRVETYIKIKTEHSNEEQQTAKVKEEELIVPTETHFIANEYIVEIKNEISNENNDKNDDPLAKENSPADVIKIENETLSDYIITSPLNITPELTPPLRTHHLLYERSHAIGPPFECEFCDYIMPTKNALYKHRLRKHNQKGSAQQEESLPTKCYLCSKVFSSISSLRKHTESGHSSKTYVCEHCGCNLPSRNALYQHRLRKHRSLRKQQNKRLKLKCSQCLEFFNTAKSLSLHKAKEHGKQHIVESNEWLECEYCGYKLPTKNALYQHRLRKHKRHKMAANNEIVLPSNESLQTHLLESQEVLPALKQLVDRL